MTDETNRDEASRIEEASAQFDRQVAETDAPRRVMVAGVVSLLGALLIYVLHLDRVVGLFVDDGWYVLLAKSLATGQGYSLINSPSSGIPPLYPPAFPFLLSLVYRIWPSFPDNVYLLKSVSIAAMMGVGVIAYRYFIRERKLPAHLALAIAVASVLSPPLVFLATSSLMSECVFALIFLLTVVVLEKCVRAGRGARSIQLAVLGASLASIGFLTRSIALALIVGGFLYLLKTRLIKSAVVFAVAVAAFTGPWMVYTGSHRPTPEQQSEQVGHIVQPYTQQFWQKRAGELGSGKITLKELPERVWNNLVQAGTEDVALLTFSPIVDAVSGATRSGFGPVPDSWVLRALSLMVTALAIAGFISALRERITLAEIAVPLTLAITLLWPWEPFRFILPMFPFIMFYVLKGAAAILPAALKSRAVAGVAFLFVAVSVYGHASSLLEPFMGSSAIGDNSWEDAFVEVENMFNRSAREFGPTDVIATFNPPLTYLYTGRKTIGVFDPSNPPESWKRFGVRYLMSVSVSQPTGVPEASGYRVVYHSSRYPYLWVVDLATPAGR